MHERLQDWFGIAPLPVYARVLIVIAWEFLVLCLWRPSRYCLMAYVKVSGLPLSRRDTMTSIKGGRSRLDAMDMQHKLFASSEHRPLLVSECKAVARAW